MGREAEPCQSTVVVTTETHTHTYTQMHNRRPTNVKSMLLVSVFWHVCLLRETQGLVQPSFGLRPSRSIARKISRALTSRGASKHDDSKEYSKNNDSPSGGESSMFDKFSTGIQSAGSYSFGDIGRKVVEEVLLTTEKTVKFLDADGDGIVSLEEIATPLSEGFKNTTEDVVRSVTGNEQYRFGDFTSAFMMESDRTLHRLRDEAMHEVLGELTSQQQQALMLTVVQTMATCVLSFNFVMNIFSGITVVLAWAFASFAHHAAAARIVSTKLTTTAATTLGASVTLWDRFMLARSSIELVLSPLLLPLAAAATLFFFNPYRDFVEYIQKALQNRLQPKDSDEIQGSPMFIRALSLSLAWLVANCTAVMAATGTGMWLVGAISRLLVPRLLR